MEKAIEVTNLVKTFGGNRTLFGGTNANPPSRFHDPRSGTGR